MIDPHMPSCPMTFIDKYVDIGHNIYNINSLLTSYKGERRTKNSSVAFAIKISYKISTLSTKDIHCKILRTKTVQRSTDNHEYVAFNFAYSRIIFIRQLVGCNEHS